MCWKKFCFICCPIFNLNYYFCDIQREGKTKLKQHLLYTYAGTCATKIRKFGWTCFMSLRGPFLPSWNATITVNITILQLIFLFHIHPFFMFILMCLCHHFLSLNYVHDILNKHNGISNYWWHFLNKINQKMFSDLKYW